MNSPVSFDGSSPAPDHCGVDHHHRVSPEGGAKVALSPMSAGQNSVGESRAAERQRLKPTFRTQASALMKKNLTYQRRNWCAPGILLSLRCRAIVQLPLLQASESFLRTHALSSQEIKLLPRA